MPLRVALFSAARLFVFAAAMGLGLVACAPRGNIAELVPASAAAAAQADLREIFVVSNRQRLDGPPFFGNARGQARHFAAFDVSVPMERAPGTIAWPPARATPDPNRHFATADATEFAALSGFAAQMQTRLAPRAPAEREVVVFVHGFNNTFPEALYRLAQIAHDFDAPALPVLFSWASAGDPRGYLFDRDSTLLARDDLAQTLIDLDGRIDAEITLVAHSMGGLLAVEALRQLAQLGRQDVIARLRGLVMIAPDIDLDLFERQARDIGRLPAPTVVMASPEDAVLEVSAWITGQSARLGSVGAGSPESARLEALGVRVLDLSGYARDASNSHLVGLTSPSLIRLLRRSRRNDAALATLLREARGAPR